MKIKKLLFLLSLFLAINSTNGTSQHLWQKFLLQKTPNPLKLPSSLLLYTPINPNNVMWSILITTIDCRTKMFCRIASKVMKQITDAKLEKKIEIIFYRDNQQQKVGYKRNQLLAATKGKYISFIDDDDDISDDYISMIYKKLLTNPDCVKLIGIMTQPGKINKTRVHSIQNKLFTDTEDKRLRPVTHINPIRRSIAIKFKFPELDFSEDKIWAIEILKSNLLKTEAPVNTPYYFYNFDPKKSVTWHKRHQEEMLFLKKIGIFKSK